MKSFATTTRINAAPAVVWDLLVDAPGYPRWNSTVDRLDGSIVLGSKVTVYAKASPGRAFPLTVTALELNRRLVFSGGMPLGLFTGTRTYTLVPQGAATTEFTMHEGFTGLLAPLITRSIPDLQPAFDQFAADLKHASEAKA